MTKGTNVSWTNAHKIAGHGVVIADEVDGHVLVAYNALPNMERLVIYCAVTWLTVEA